MIFNLSRKEIPAISVIGGKAKSLMETTQQGFNVPEGIVLSVDFFNLWFKDLKTTEAWKNWTQSPERKNCDAVKQIVEKLQFSSEQKAILDKELSFISSTVFAVRSSSPEEDLEDLAFAGIYETILGVKTEMLEAVNKPVVIDAELRATLAEIPVQCLKDYGGDPNSVQCQWATCLQYGQSSAQRPECSDIRDLLVETLQHGNVSSTPVRAGEAP